ncbi:MAG: ATP-binding cassette domain-containing protein [Burkholderiales bacterium]|nr:ATP-binding cassette domain-containing protein [Burkholderiales bacterium]
MAAPVLHARQLCFGYPQRKLFTDWDCALPAGVTLLQGGEGTGKTTLLRLLAGDLAAQSGTLQCAGVTLNLSTHKAYQEQVFCTDPRSGAFESITPKQFFAQMADRYPRLDSALVLELADDLALTPHLEKTFFMLSTGTKRKVWLAAAFASGAAVTLLDEPFAALDKTSIGLVVELLQEAARHPTRAWVLADYAPPQGVPLALTIDLGG